MLTFKVDSSLQRIVWRNLWMTPPSNDGARGLSPKWGSARVSSLNFSRNKFKLGVAMGTVRGLDLGYKKLFFVFLVYKK